MDTLLEKLKTSWLLTSLSDHQIESLIEEGTFHTISLAEGKQYVDFLKENHAVLLKGEIIAQRQNPQNEQQVSQSKILSSENSKKIPTLCSTGLKMTLEPKNEDAQLLLLNANKLDRLIGWGVTLDEVKLDKRQADKVRHTQIFQKIPYYKVRQIFELMTIQTFKRGDVVIKQGDQGDCYYFIEEGEVEVWQKDPFTDETTMVATLSEGDTFGEEALLQDGFRNATIIMKTDGQLHALSKENFTAMIQPNLLTEIEANKANTLLQMQTGSYKLLDCRYDIEYEDYRIPKAQLIPLHKMRKMIKKLDPNIKYIIYCRSGRRSKAAAFIMQEYDFTAFSLVGGITDWPYELDMEMID
ncbi:cyclic nucleotide-binding domain-containing protein [Magnetococcales bacterium HHB-1]